MLTDIHTTSNPVGLKMHLGKTKVMFNDHVTPTNITVAGTTIDQVDSYIYLGRKLTQNGDLLPEIKRRIALGWSAFGQVDNIMRSKKATMKIKRKVFNEYILPVMTYGSETWALSKSMETMLAVAQRKMERIMIGITLRDRRRNTWIRQQTKVTDVIATIRRSKHRWAGHISKLKDNRWTIRTTEWTPRDWRRPRGRPKERWHDDLIRHLGPRWPQLARDRVRWRDVREGFLLRE